MQVDGINYYTEPGKTFALSEQIFTQEFTESGTLTNNEFLNIGLLRTSTFFGMPVTKDIKIIGIDWQNSSVNTATISVYSNVKGITGIVVGTVAISSALQGYTNVDIDIPAGNFVALQWNGSTNQSPVMLLKYRLKHTL